MPRMQNDEGPSSAALHSMDFDRCPYAIGALFWGCIVPSEAEDNVLVSVSATNRAETAPKGGIGRARETEYNRFVANGVAERTDPIAIDHGLQASAAVLFVELGAGIVDVGTLTDTVFVGAGDSGGV